MLAGISDSFQIVSKVHHFLKSSIAFAFIFTYTYAIAGVLSSNKVTLFEGWAGLANWEDLGCPTLYLLNYPVFYSEAVYLVFLEHQVHVCVVAELRMDFVLNVVQKPRHGFKHRLLSKEKVRPFANLIKAPLI